VDGTLYDLGDFMAREAQDKARWRGGAVEARGPGCRLRGT
jgi:hypothetical protein